MKVSDAWRIAQQLGVEDNEVIRTFLKDEECLDRWNRSDFIQVMQNESIKSLKERVEKLEERDGI